MKIFSTILILLFLAGCSGHIAPPAVKFGKKCTVAEDGNVVYSYIWLHKKGEELKANKETCKQIQD
tara:strand:+ start:114 stop:311 length:198 start_codon:yes stop_codon:yes gene_type:complete